MECTFGIVKGRWRILKLPLQYREKCDIDNIFMTCCILHNVIHAFDGRLEWERDVDWAGVDGRLDAKFVENDLVDFSAVGRGNIRAGADNDTDVEVEQDYYTLRADLVRHYSCAVQCNEVTWLRSNPDEQEEQ